jgi:uncharacterized RDD family membrane protein YckC
MTATPIDAADAAGGRAAPAVAYVGFWIRFGAALIDLAGVLFLALPAIVRYFGDAWTTAQGVWAFLINWVLPGVVAVAFWAVKGATPGKMLVSAMVVDAQTLGEPSLGQLVRRYVAYFSAALPFGFGLVAMAFDARKQGWHDKIAGTVVIRGRR